MTTFKEMTDEQISEFAERFYTLGHSGQLVFDVNGYTRALLAAGASEERTDHPLDIRAYIVTDRSSGAKALKWAAELGNRFPSELYQLIPLTHHADAVAELTALRERIAALEARETRADTAQERITYPGDTHLLQLARLRTPAGSCPNWPCCPCERREDCTVCSSGA